MKGIIMQRGERKSIVLFNNGKIGEIPTRPNCEEGTVITVSYNRRLIAVVSLFSFVVLLCAIFVLRSVYYDSFGYIQINYGNAALELAYNRFQHLLAIRPLNVQAVEPVAALSLSNTKIETAYEKIILAFARSPSFPSHEPVLVRIAQDDLAGAKKIESNLTLLSSPLMAVSQKELTVTFELYTHELYREAMTANSQNSEIAPIPSQDNVPRMHGRQRMHGGRNRWCW
ncbi:MAG: hypothetical protein LBH20_07250 [Treponema sp.]|jgi:hypothetical protein|nr:hypothetical protein [Treponema sp.]